MSYKNSVKLFVSNFNLFWKQLLYMLICAGIFLLCFFTTLNPIATLLKNNGIFDEIKTIIQTVYSSPSELALMLSESFKHIINVITANFSSIWLQVLGLIILGIFLPNILIQMSFFNLSSILYQKLTMNMNVRYVQNALQTLKSSFFYALANIIFNLPFFVLTMFLIYLYLIIATTVMASIIGLIILSAILLILTSFKITIFTCYVGYMVENNANPFVAFGKGFVASFKHFWKIISMSIIVLLTIIFVNGFIAVFTFFSGLIIVIPGTFVFLAIYYLVVYFNIKGERYYLSPNLIFNPVKYVVKQDYFTGEALPEEIKEVQVTTTKMPRKKRQTKSKSKKTKKSNNNE